MSKEVVITRIGDIKLTEDALKELFFLQENNNDAIKDMIKHLNNATEFILKIVDSSKECEQVKAFSLVAGLAHTTDSIRKLKFIQKRNEC